MLFIWVGVLINEESLVKLGSAFILTGKASGFRVVFLVINCGTCICAAEVAVVFFYWHSLGLSIMQCSTCSSTF